MKFLDAPFETMLKSKTVEKYHVYTAATNKQLQIAASGFHGEIGKAFNRATAARKHVSKHTLSCLVLPRTDNF
jgi:hypothetical protein